MRLDEARRSDTFESQHRREVAGDHQRQHSLHVGQTPAADDMPARGQGSGHSQLRQSALRGRLRAAAQRDPDARRRGRRESGAPRPPYGQRAFRIHRRGAAGRFLAFQGRRTDHGRRDPREGRPNVLQDSHRPCRRGDAPDGEGGFGGYRRRGVLPHNPQQDRVAVRGRRHVRRGVGRRRRPVLRGGQGVRLRFRHGLPDKGRHPGLCGRLQARKASRHGHQRAEDNSPSARSPARFGPRAGDTRKDTGHPRAPRILRGDTRIRAGERRSRICARRHLADIAHYNAFRQI